MSRINIIELCTVLLILSASYVSSFPITHHHQSYPRTTISLHSTKDNDAPYREAAYNPTAASAFYQNRQLQSLSRLSQILTKSVGFLTSTAIDAKLNKEDEMADKRSEELLELISDLGPTFIKVSDGVLISIPQFYTTYSYVRAIINYLDWPSSQHTDRSSSCKVRPRFDKITRCSPTFQCSTRTGSY